METQTQKEPDYALRFDLRGRVALVTGASSGLGHRFARVLAAAGAKVAVGARRADRLRELKGLIESEGGVAQAVSIDVTDTASFPAVFDEIARTLGPVDLLVNNAGISAEAKAVETTAADYDDVMAVNVKAPYFLSTELARRLVAANRGGAIINISSVGAEAVLPTLSAYCISKAALSMQTRAFAREWARYGIAVNAIAPGYIETEMNDSYFRSEPGQKQIKGMLRRRLQGIETLDGILLLLASEQGQGLAGSIVKVDDGQFI